MTFTQILNLSICASWLVLAVAAVRLLLKNAPKAFHCALWALVALRLLLPVSIESEVSLVPSREVIPESYLVMEPVRQDTPAKLDIVTNPVYETPVTIDTETTVARVQNWDMYATIFWLAGMGAMALYAAYSYLSLRLRVRLAAWSSENIWESDDVDSPFILGLLRPRIYLPSGLDKQTRDHVLAHEKAHLKRLDHIWKPLGFVLLTVHWFNPIMWLGYILLCRDIELACDEKVIKNLEKPQIRAYSEALIACSVSHRMIAACPLAFGEVGVKGRIRSMLNYRKPRFWIVLTALVVSVILAVCFLTDPAQKPGTLEELLERGDRVITSVEEQQLTLTIPKNKLPENVLDGSEHFFEPEEIVLWDNGSTRLYLSCARLSGDELRLHFKFAYEPEAEGELLLPYDPWNDEWDHFVRLASRDIRDNGKTYPDAATLSVLGDDCFTVAVTADAFEQIGQAISLEMRGLYLVGFADPDAYLTDQDLYRSWSGLKILDAQERSRMLTIPMSLVPDDLDTGDTVDFEECEIVVWEEQGTIIWLKRLEVEENQVRLHFDFSLRLSDTGTIVVPANLEEEKNTIRITNSSVWMDEGGYDNVVYCHANGPGTGFGVTMERYAFEADSSILSFQVDGLCFVSYMKYSSPAARLLQTRWTIAEGVYADPHNTFAYLPGSAPVYSIGEDLRFTATTETATWTHVAPAGALQQLTLTEESFDAKFDPEGWADGDLARKLRQENEAAWTCSPEDASNIAYQLLLQRDGTLYLLLTMPREGIAADLFRLEPYEGSASQPMTTVASYGYATLDAFSTPRFQLSSDGTFTFSENSLSSYLGTGVYQLTDEELILQTSDGRYRWCFTVVENGFAFDAARSNPVTYYPDPRTTALLADGARFLGGGSTLYPSEQLTAEIEAEILVENASSYAGENLCVETHVILDMQELCIDASDGGTMLLKVYLLAAYQEYDVHEYAIDLLTSRTFPAVLTFESWEHGWRIKSYETPVGNELQKLFSEGALEQLQAAEAELTEYLLELCSQKAAVQVTSASVGEQNALVRELDALLEEICSSPAFSSNPGDYVEAHPEQMARAESMGMDALRYCFAEFADGQQTDLRGHVMAILCQRIITSSGESCETEGYMTGQDWFSGFLQEAVGLRDALDDSALLHEQYPCHAIALEAVGLFA